MSFIDLTRQVAKSANYRGAGSAVLNSRFATIYTIHSILSQSSHKNLQVGLYVVKLVEHAIRHFFFLFRDIAIEGLMIASRGIQVIKAAA